MNQSIKKLRKFLGSQYCLQMITTNKFLSNVHLNVCKNLLVDNR